MLRRTDILYVYRNNTLLFMAKYSRDGLPYLCLAAATESALPAVDGAADLKLLLVITLPEVQVPQL